MDAAHYFRVPLRLCLLHASCANSSSYVFLCVPLLVLSLELLCFGQAMVFGRFGGNIGENWRLFVLVVCRLVVAFCDGREKLASRRVSACQKNQPRKKPTAASCCMRSHPFP